VERLFWFAPGSPKAKTERLCTDYKRRPSASDRRTRADRRPSGHTARQDAAFFAGPGRLPDDLFACGVAHPSEPWRRRAKSLGIAPHPAVFPPAVAHRLLTALSDPGDVVLDPFMGSGTTAAVAEALGRRWIGIEKSRRYAKLAGLRLIDHGVEWLGPDTADFTAFERSCK
jgi:site-specific DNA-methyltransferase (cytosine-N4-specific)